ncbi:MAG: TRAP transporter small permease [Tropicimonas sp.]|uniref:TRAP transporter small permease n=1 Tax=Tropicimonas sp. TaxID=2067044 RepID=UPI003A83FDDB
MPSPSVGNPAAGLRLQVARLLEQALFAFCVMLLIALFLIIIVAVFSRALGNSLSWYDEVASVGLAWLTFYGSALAALKSAHLNFDALLRPLPATLRCAAFFIAKAITIGFFAAMAWAGGYLLAVFGAETLTSLNKVPLAFTQSALPIGAALFILAELLTMPEGLAAIARPHHSGGKPS